MTSSAQAGISESSWTSAAMASEQLKRVKSSLGAFVDPRCVYVLISVSWWMFSKKKKLVKKSMI